MNMNVGQVNAKPIAPPWLTQKLVDESAVATPAVLIRTPYAVPNAYIAPQTYLDQPLKELLLACKELGAVVAKQLFPDHQGVIDGLCLAFDLVGKVRELVESAAFDLNDALDLGKIGLDGVQLGQIALRGGQAPPTLVQAQAGVGFIVKVRDAYFAGPLADPVLPTLATLPDQGLSKNLYKILTILGSDQFHAALLAAGKPFESAKETKL
jgi:hypothetical protein